MTGIDPSLHPSSPSPPPPILSFFLPSFSPFPRVIVPILSLRSSRSSLSSRSPADASVSLCFCSAFARSLRWHSLSFVPTEGKLSLLLHARVTDPVVSTTPCSFTHTLCPLCPPKCHCRLRDRMPRSLASRASFGSDPRSSQREREREREKEASKTHDADACPSPDCVR